jgi:hypothetical protein
MANTEHGPPWAVLEFIDRVENPSMPLVLDVATKASMATALPHAEIGLRAARARYAYVAERADALREICSGMERLDALENVDA